MNRRKFLKFSLIISALSYGLISTSYAQEATLISEGLTFFRDGTQIIKNENKTLIRLTNGNVYDDKELISSYIISRKKSDISRHLPASENMVLNFNRAIITRKNMDYMEDNGTEIIVIYSDTGKPLESYDSKGEIKKFIYDTNEKITKVDSSRFGLIDIDEKKCTTCSN